jgi:hypothetical protein
LSETNTIGYYAERAGKPISETPEDVINYDEEEQPDMDDDAFAEE